MDTTVALIFSLGLAFGGQDTSSAGIETSSDQIQNTKLSQRQQKVRQRIKLTNAWLKRQKQARRALVQSKHNSNDIQLARSLSCTADWNTA